MFFYLFSHFLQIWLLPPGFNLIMGFTGFIIQKRWRMLGRLIVLISLISLYLLSTPIVAQILIDGLQYQYPHIRWEDLLNQNRSAAIVVLGGGYSKAPEYETYSVSDVTLARLNFAVHLHRKFNLPIIVSGGTLDKSSRSEADLMIDALRTHYRVLAVSKEDRSINTADEAKFLLPLLQQKKINKIYLVTNAWHIPRSMFVIENKGIKVVPAPMGYITLNTKGSFNYLPTINGLNTSVIALHEFIGILWLIQKQWLLLSN